MYKITPEYKKPKLREVTKIEFQDEILTGVIRRVGHLVPKVIELWSSDSNIIQKGVVLGDDGHCNDDEMDKLMEKGRQRLDVQTKGSKTSDILRTVGVAAPAPSELDSEDDDALLNAVWAVPSSSKTTNVGSLPMTRASTRREGEV